MDNIVANAMCLWRFSANLYRWRDEFNVADLVCITMWVQSGTCSMLKVLAQVNQESGAHASTVGVRRVWSDSLTKCSFLCCSMSPSTPYEHQMDKYDRERDAVTYKAVRRE